MALTITATDITKIIPMLCKSVVKLLLYTYEKNFMCRIRQNTNNFMLKGILLCNTTLLLLLVLLKREKGRCLDKTELFFKCTSEGICVIFPNPNAQKYFQLELHRTLQK